MNADKQTTLKTFWSRHLKPIIVIVVVVSTFRSSIADWNDVPTQSMEPTILVGDRFFVNKLAYDLKIPFTTWRVAEWNGPKSGEIIVFYSPDDGERMVKRVIGVPGDHIEMRSNQLYINGAAIGLQTDSSGEFGSIDLTDPAPHVFVKESLTSSTHAMMLQPTRQARRSFGEITLPRDQYFVMGDNRDNSRDSRFFSFVPRDQILGQAVGLAFSLDYDRWYAPRWERFLRGLD